jgi:hypothetical protein
VFDLQPNNIAAHLLAQEPIGLSVELLMETAEIKRDFEIARTLIGASAGLHPSDSTV